VDRSTSKINFLAIMVAGVAAITVSAIWYSPLVFGKQWMELRSLNSPGMTNTAIPMWKPLVDVVREFVVIYVIASFVSRLGIADWKSALSLGFWVWLGFPVQMLVGASLWDNKPWTLDLIHAGDWLMKMLVESLILSQWPRISSLLDFRVSSQLRNNIT
jgi:hypothetical protein